MKIEKTSTLEGLSLLKKPVMPLARMLQLLFLTGPFTKIAEILPELPDPIETAGVTYEKPGEILKPYLHALSLVEFLKTGESPPWLVLNEQFDAVDQLESLDLMMSHQIISRELEDINSLLCGPCGCTLCCIGPDDSMNQDFFEIPLAASEKKLFDLPVFDSEETRNALSLSDPPLEIDNNPFYQKPSSLYHWKTGWSLILPRGSSCVHLNPENGACNIYPDRPITCRKPQIFSYVLEPHPDQNREENGQLRPAYVARKKILAVWDCPYVREFKKEIADYAELSELEIIFRENKS